MLPNYIDWLEVFLRSFFTLVALFLFMKIYGKKQISRLSYFEYILGITVGSLAADLSLNIQKSVIDGIVGILVWMLIPLLVELLSMKNKKFADFAQGTSTVLIKSGKVMEDNLKKERLTVDELLEQLRKNKVFQVADVEFATLEPSGSLSVLLKRKKQPLAVGDLFPNPPSIKEPQTVIMDGKILDEPLATMRLNRGWLKEELDKMGVTPENVLLAQVDSYGELTVDLYDDKIQVPPPVTKELLLASIKKVYADFELFALQTEDYEAKEMYTKNAAKINEILQRVTPHLK